MFSLKVVDTDDFLDMGQGSQLLYFHMAMRADDDGFVNSPKKIMRFAGAKDDDMKVLIAKQFILPFQSGVIVIRHWKENNYIQSDRKHDTIYEEEMAQLREGTGGVYEMYTECIQDVSIMDTEDRLGKDRLGKGTPAKDKPSPESTQDSKEIAEVIKLFEVVNPSVYRLYGHKTQRQACERLLKKWSLPQIKAIVHGVLPELNADQFAKGKSITPVQMESNLGFIKAYIDKKNKGSAMVSV